MFHVTLFEPEIPPNTGNIIRLCANTGSQLHLIHPLGFNPDDKQLQRAGLDYHDWVKIQHHENYPLFLQQLPGRLFAFSTKGTNYYHEVNYQMHDVFLFGPETRGLPDTILKSIEPENLLRIPMIPNNRSLNLSNAVALVLYEAWRQLNFSGGK
jgi:tRNA (cytidine/uridine-2'-O-)-methyltransferase